MGDASFSISSSSSSKTSWMRIEPADVIIHWTFTWALSSSIDFIKPLTSIFLNFDFFLSVIRRTTRLSLLSKSLILLSSPRPRYSCLTANIYVAEQGSNEVPLSAISIEINSQPCGSCEERLFVIRDSWFVVWDSPNSGVAKYGSLVSATCPCEAPERSGKASAVAGRCILRTSSSSSDSTPTGLGNGKENLGWGLKP